ncbi:MAG: YabP/YqfC family sporulation protein [Clostridia bacterium]|nr:YabP/YqfC family sporulation protein [Clostridia bacterium]
MKLDEKDFIIELRGNRRCLIEGISGLAEYGENAVAARAGSAVIRINGKGLRMYMMAEDRLGICGEISLVQLEQNDDK